MYSLSALPPISLIKNSRLTTWPPRLILENQMAESIEKQIKRLARKLNNIAKRETPKAAASALNKTARLARTPTVKEVAKDTKVAAKHIRKRAYISRATPKKQRARIYGYARPVKAVMLLKRNEINKSELWRGTNQRGVRVAGRQFNGAFVSVHRKSGNIQVFRRKTSRRMPLEVISIPISETFNDRLKANTRKKMKTDFRRILQSELKFRLNKYSR